MLSPITAGKVIFNNLNNVEDTTGVRLFWAIPGYIWVTGLTIGASVLRAIAGAFELVPGLVLVFTDAELDPLFDPVEKGEGLIWDRPTPVMDIRLGVDYTSAPF